MTWWLLGVGHLMSHIYMIQWGCYFLKWTLTLVVALDLKKTLSFPNLLIISYTKRTVHPTINILWLPFVVLPYIFVNLMRSNHYIYICVYVSNSVTAKGVLLMFFVNSKMWFVVVNRFQKQWKTAARYDTFRQTNK